MSSLINRLVIIVFLASLAAACSDFQAPLENSSVDPVPSEVDSPIPSAAISSLANLFDENIQYSQQIYLSSIATAGAGDGSLNNPYADWNEANVTPGTEIILLPGNYGRLSTIDFQGTEAAPIKIRGQGAAIIDADSTPGNGNGLTLREVRYLVLENIQIQDTPFHGINIDDGGSFDTPSEFVIFRNLRIQNSGQLGGNLDCIKMSGVDNFYLINNDLSACQQNTPANGECIDMVGAHNGIIHGNRFGNNNQHCVQTKGGSSDILIHGNVFSNVGGHAINIGGSTDPNLIRPQNSPTEAQRIRAMSNIIINAEAAAAAFIACWDCEFINNTVINPGRWPIRLLEGGSDGNLFPSLRATVANNIFQFSSNRVSTHLNIGQGMNANDVASSQFFSNLWFSIDNPNFAQPNLGPLTDNNALIQQNPGFVNPTNANYQLLENSPAKSAGSNIYQNEPTIIDFGGNTYLNPPSIGAFQ